MRRAIRPILMAAALAALVATGGYAAGTAETAAPTGEPIAEQSWSDWDFPEALPERPQPMPESAYAYVDNSIPVAFEAQIVGFVNTPLPDPDPLAEYLRENYNATVTLQSYSAADHQTSLSARFAGGDAPEVAYIPYSQRDLAEILYESGQLLNAAKLLPYMPQYRNYVTETYARWASYNDDEWVGFPRYPIFPNNWGLFIRQDWLDYLGMDHPQTTEDLFEYAMAVTYEDPNQSGDDDTWFMGGAGSGRSFQMLEELRSAFGHPSYNVADGRINHPMLDGTTRDFLQYLKRLRDAGVLSPDWYTIGWEEFKAYSIAGRIGMVRYPGWNLVNEMVEGNQNDLAYKDVWNAIDPVTAPDGRGGRLRPAGTPDGMFVFRADLADNPDRLRRIARTLEAFAYPNPSYANLIQGGGPDIWPEKTFYQFNEEDGTKVFTRLSPLEDRYASLGDWQRFGITLVYEVFLDEPGLTGAEQNQRVQAMPRWENYDMLLSLDSARVADLREFTGQNEIAFVLGERSFDDWDSYVEQWKAAGGEALLRQAAEQLSVEY